MSADPNLVRALHAAADRVWSERGTPAMDALADAIGEFIQTSDIDDDEGNRLSFDGPSLGYGAMLGWLARDGL